MLTALLKSTQSAVKSVTSTRMKANGPCKSRSVLSSPIPTPTLESRIISKAPTASPLINTFILEKPRGFDYKPGQAIHLLIPNPDTKELQQATFSMVSAPIPSNNSTIEIAVKATKYSPIQWLMEKAKEGDSILIGAEPTGSTFDFLSSHPTDPLVFIGAGIGITPILSITQYLESHPKSRIKPSTIGILHQARSSTEFLHWERLINFSKRTPRTKLAYLLSERANERELDRMDSELAQYTRIGTLPQFIADTRLDRNTNIILCGPVGFVSDTKRWLMTHQGIPEHKLHSD